MTGDERTRFCDVCGLHVHNLSVLTTNERASLLRNNAGRVCVTYQRRLNGSYVTPERPLIDRERSNLRQVGAVALSAAALTLVAGCVTKPDAISGQPTVSAPALAVGSQPGAADEEVVVLTGFVIEADEDSQAYKAADTLAGNPNKKP